MRKQTTAMLRCAPARATRSAGRSFLFWALQSQALRPVRRIHSPCPCALVLHVGDLTNRPCGGRDAAFLLNYPHCVHLRALNWLRQRNGHVQVDMVCERPLRVDSPSKETAIVMACFLLNR